MKANTNRRVMIFRIGAVMFGLFGGAVLLHGLAEAPPPAKAAAPLSPEAIRARLLRLQEQTTGLKELIEQARARQRDPAYALVTVTVLENFVGYALEDLDGNETQRAAEQLIIAPLRMASWPQEMSLREGTVRKFS